MNCRILILLKSERYRKGLADFLGAKLPDAQIVTAESAREFSTLNKDFSVYILSSVLTDGIWLKAATLIEKKDRIVVIQQKKGPALSLNTVKRRGVNHLFTIPLNSAELFTTVRGIIKKNEEHADVPDIITRKIQDRIEKTHDALDSKNYYELLGVGDNSSADEIKKKYMQMARDFHPDRFRRTSPDIRRMVYAIAKRLNEAYSVLSNKNRRNIYDEDIRKDPSRIRFDFQKKVGREETPEDSIEDKQVRKFVRLAREAMEAGDYKSAFMQLTLANQKLPGNKYVTRLLEEAKKRK